VRVANYVPFLAAHGVELDFVSTLTSEEYALTISAASAVKKAAVLVRAAARARSLVHDDRLLLLHRLLLLTPCPGIDPPRHVDAYDLDDALFVGSAAQNNRRFQWTKQEGRRALACMGKARLVTVSTSFLADHARQHAAHVEVLPSCVDPEVQPLHDHHAGDHLVIGWIGSHTTAPYLEPVLPLIAGLHERDARIRLVVVGGDTGLRNDWIEHRPWSEATQAADLASFDVGIMPLPDSDWTRGKAGYKLLQYFSAGVPAVASPVGVNAELVADGRGFTADGDSEWVRALTDLLRDPHERHERGQAARRFVKEHYSYQRWAPELAALLRSLAV